MSEQTNRKNASLGVEVVLVGDSDIARWPEQLLPSGTKSVSGHSGATLAQVLPHVLGGSSSTIFVVCAGENDIDSVPLWESEASFRDLVKRCVGSHLIFLGPKLEPWLQDDTSSRKKYFQMATAFQTDLKDCPHATFVNCLTEFCNEGKDEPGAVFKAKPDPKFFDGDQLHLSDEGYRKWKLIVEDEILQISRIIMNVK